MTPDTPERDTPELPTPELADAGPVEAFAALYEATAPSVRAYLARRLADPAACDDLTMDVYLVAWRRRDQLPHEPLPWLLGCARRCLANHRRALARRQRLVDRIGRLARPDGVQRELADPLPPLDPCLVAALANLRALDRELLLLIAWDGLTIKSASRVLGLRAATARTRLHRARLRLRQELSANDDPTPKVSSQDPAQS